MDALSSSGRLTSAFYSFERATQDTATSLSFRAYQTGQVKFSSLGERRELTFRAYGRVSKDFADSPVSDPAYRLYHAYLQWNDSKNRFRLKFGRQTVFVGVGVGRIDGVRAEINAIPQLELTVYGGALVAGGKEGIRSPAEASMVGAEVVAPDIKGARLGASIYRKSREVEPYFSTARLTSGLTTAEIRPGEVEQQMVGFDASRSFGSLDGVIRWDLSTPHSLKTRRFEGVLRYQEGGWNLSAEYLHRTPYIDQNSIFTVFTQSSNQEVSFRANRRMSHRLGFFSEISRLEYEGDDGYRINIGVNILNGYIGYVRRTGFGGSSDGLNGVLRYRLNAKFSTSASIGMSSFRTYSGTDVRSRVLANTLGMTYRPHRKLSIHLQGQSLSQDLIGSSSDPFRGAGHDLRVFFSASTWFFSKGDK